MYRKKLTLEVIVKSLASFSFGFLLGYIVFSLIANPNTNRVFADTDTEPTPGPEEVTSNPIINDTTAPDSNPNDTQNDTSYPKTYSDLPDSSIKPAASLLHRQKPSYIHIYDYAKYSTPITTSATTETAPEEKEEQEETTENSSQGFPSTPDPETYDTIE